MIVLKFVDPEGRVGFTEADNSHEAVKMAKDYKRDGYRLVGHFFDCD